MDTLETQLLLEASTVKSPALAAIVGFFDSGAGCLLHRTDRHWNPVLIIDFLNLMLALTGIGVITAFLFRSLTVPLAHAWAREMNQMELEHTIAALNAQRIQGPKTLAVNLGFDSVE